MEIEKVVRILTILLAVAALAVMFATRLMFPDSSDGFNLPLVITLLLCLSANLTLTAEKKRKNRNNE